MKHYITTKAYLSGAICGSIWQPGFDNCGIPYREDLRRRFNRFSDRRGATFKDVLLHVLMEKGGDFQNPRFSADTALIIKRCSDVKRGHYGVHVKAWLVLDLPDCKDLVAPDTFASDYYG